MEVETQPLPNSSFPFPLHLHHHHHQQQQQQHADVTTSDFSLGFNRDSQLSISDFNSSQVDSADLFSEQSRVDLCSNDVSTAEIDQVVDTCQSMAAAVKVQKVYRSYRTRRRLADSAVVIEEYWRQLLDFSILNRSTISFFDFSKSETPASRWNRVSKNASIVGRGLNEDKDSKAQKLALQHWIEAIDPRHRYGHSLHFYYEEWCKTNAGQPFFYWLDIGDGRCVDLKACPRSKLRKQCIKYFGPQERERYEYIVVDGNILNKLSEEPLDTTKGSKEAKWIFVMSTLKQLYAAEKKKGEFHHSSFLAGGATLAAGRLVVVEGVVKSIWAYSGHYRPTDDNLNCLLDFLKDNGANTDEVEIRSSTEDYEYNGDSKSNLGESAKHFEYQGGKSNLGEISKLNECNGDSKSNAGEIATKDASGHIEPSEAKAPQIEIPDKVQKHQPSELDETAKNGSKTIYQRTLSGGLQSPRAEVPKKVIMQRINSKKMARSYQLGHQLSLKWSTGAGPRIGCVADYPQELISEALEFVNLSPRIPPTPSSRQFASLVSPTSRLADL